MTFLSNYSRYAMNKICIVTGGAGFIGSNLCKRLLDQYCTVYCVDNLSSSKGQNLDLLNKYANFYHINQDISSIKFSSQDAFDFVKRLPNIRQDLFNVDSKMEIWHLACPASPKQYQYNPIATLMTSVVGTHNMLMVAKEFNIPILFTSTSEVYGDPLIHPQPESYFGNVNPIGIRSCYDEGKRAAETLCFDFIRTYSMDVRVVRLFNTYGPCMDVQDGRVVSNFINQALYDEPITIYGDGSQTRSFCYVDDTINAMALVMNLKSSNLVLNIGNPIEYTIKQIADIVLDLTPNTGKSSIEYKELPLDDPKVRQPVTNRLEQLTGWKPNVDLKTGLKLTINYFNNLKYETNKTRIDKDLI